jgi:hypothetical protein
MVIVPNINGTSSALGMNFELWVSTNSTFSMLQLLIAPFSYHQGQLGGFL